MDNVPTGRQTVRKGRDSLRYLHHGCKEHIKAYSPKRVYTAEEWSVDTVAATEKKNKSPKYKIKKYPKHQQDHTGCSSDPPHFVEGNTRHGGNNTDSKRFTMAVGK